MVHSENRHPIAFHSEVEVLLWFCIRNSVNSVVYSLRPMVNSVVYSLMPRIHSPTVGIVCKNLTNHGYMIYCKYIN